MMSNKIESKKIKDEKNHSESKDIVTQQELMDEDLNGVTGGRSEFADVPRVPSRDYDDSIKKKI
jgi:hypothetical protein